MIIYIDQMFLENFIMNYIIIFLSFRLAKLEGKWYRFSLGAGIGAIYVILSYILGFFHEVFIIPKILLSVIMILVSFSFSKIKDFFKVLVFFYGTTFFIGGVSLGLAYFLNISMIKEGGVLYVEEFPVLMIVVGTIFSSIIGIWIIKMINKKIIEEKFLVKICIEIMGRSIETVALMDSGNELKDPISKNPVIIVENEVLKEIIPKKIIEKIKNNDFEMEEVWKKRIRVISISTINLENTISIAFKIDQCIVFSENEEKYIKDILVVGCDRVLSSAGKYHALIGYI